MTARMPERMDLYVDESGQDTQGELFVVAGVAVKNSDKARQRCKSIERTSSKGIAKWGRANKNKRLVYLHSVISDDRFKDFILFSYVFRKTKDYIGATIQGIDLAVASLYPSDDPVYVYVDALVGSHCNMYKTRLRKLGCYVRKVRGIAKDENEPLIRLADAVAGATRDLLEYKNYELTEIFSKAIKQGVLVGWQNSIYSVPPGPRPTVYM